jgi:hypothetical protein
MKTVKRIAATVPAALMAAPNSQASTAPKMKMTTDIPASIITPDSVETRLGTLKFKDGVPDNATAQKLFDEVDYVHAFEAVIGGYAAVNQLALLKGFRAAGVNDNEVLVTPGLMDAKSLFLTANADTYYFWGYLAQLSRRHSIAEPRYIGATPKFRAIPPVQPLL